MKATWSNRVRTMRNVAWRVAAFALAIVVLRTAWHFVVRDDARALIDGPAEKELIARRDYLASHIDRAHDSAGSDDARQFAGEWSIVTLSMTALAAANIGFEHSDTVPSDLELITRCADLAQKKEARAFDANRWGDDPLDAMNGANAHIGYLGHLALVLESYRLLGGKDAALLALEDKVIAALDTKMKSANASALLPTYPNETYTADNAVVLAALALADVGRGAHQSGAATTAKAPHAALLSKTIATWKSSLVDGATQILVFGDGARAVPRASGAALSAMMLEYVDERFATEQAAALAAHFDDRVFHFFSAECETTSCDGSGDIDSGPLVRGASPSATGFAIALAKRAGDEERLDHLLSTAEWAGMTFSWGGRRRYLFAPLVGDAVVLAAKSARAWDVRYL